MRWHGPIGPADVGVAGHVGTVGVELDGGAADDYGFKTALAKQFGDESGEEEGLGV